MRPTENELLKYITASHIHMNLSSVWHLPCWEYTFRTYPSSCLSNSLCCLLLSWVRTQYRQWGAWERESHTSRMRKEGKVVLTDFLFLPHAALSSAKSRTSCCPISRAFPPCCLLLHLENYFLFFWVTLCCSLWVRDFPFPLLLGLNFLTSLYLQPLKSHT